ncbi:MAG: ABC transporter substrate-binding protein [Armatimonadetes bacterium]|nr:ABC transporter substrate-binding protein [Armatimonadota bacterium]
MICWRRGRAPRRAAGLLLAGLLLSGLLAAGTAAAPGAPKVFRMVLGGDALTLDPALGNDLQAILVTSNLYSTLVRADAEGNFYPDAAASWRTSPDGRTWRFVLRDNLRFHNGRAVTAQDVKYSLERLAWPETRSPNARTLLGDVVGFEEVAAGRTRQLSGVRAVDDRTVEIRVNFPMRGEFLARLSFAGTAIVAREIVEAGGKTWDEKASAGTGPYRLVTWTRNMRIAMERFSGYFGGAVKVDRVEFIVLPEGATQLAMYENNEVDLAAVPIAEYRRVSAHPVLSKELITGRRSQALFLGLNPRVYPAFRDVRVRRAFAHAINREAIVRTVFQGLYRVANGLVPPGVPAHNPSLRGHDYNPERARALLAEAGWSGRLPPLSLPFNPRGADYRLLAEPVAAMLRQNLGVQTQVPLMDYARFRAEQQALDKFQAFVAGWSAPFHDPMWYLDGVLYSKSPNNWTNYNSPEYDRMLDQALAIVDPRARTRALQQAEAKAIADDLALVPLMYSEFLYLKKPHVKGIETFTMGLGLLPFRNLAIER